MRHLNYGIILLSSLFNIESFAMDSSPATLEKVIQSPNPVESLEGIKKNDPAQAWSLCEAVLEPDFYNREDVINMGPIKRGKIIKFCQELRIELKKPLPGSLKGKEPSATEEAPKKSRPVGKLGNLSLFESPSSKEAPKESKQVGSLAEKAKQFEASSSPVLPTPEKHVKKLPTYLPKMPEPSIAHEEKHSAASDEVHKEKTSVAKLITLHDINLKKDEGQSLESEQKQLQKASEVSKANLEEVKAQLDKEMSLEKNSQKEAEIKEKQKKILVLQEQQTTTEGIIKEAQGFYDNLGIMITSMRMDLSEIKHELKVFKPSDHEHDTLEVFLNAAIIGLHKENISGFTQSLKRTFPQFLEQLPLASKILEQANENLSKARHDLERINRELVELAK
jgi:hypothetical protein